MRNVEDFIISCLDLKSMIMPCYNSLSTSFEKAFRKLWQFYNWLSGFQMLVIFNDIFSCILSCFRSFSTFPEKWIVIVPVFYCYFLKYMGFWKTAIMIFFLIIHNSFPDEFVNVFTKNISKYWHKEIFQWKSKN